MKQDLELQGQKFILIDVSGEGKPKPKKPIFDCTADALDSITEPGTYAVVPVYVIEKIKKSTNGKSTKQNNKQGKANSESKTGNEMDERNKAGQPGTEGEDIDSETEEEKNNKP